MIKKSNKIFYVIQIICLFFVQVVFYLIQGIHADFIKKTVDSVYRDEDNVISLFKTSRVICDFENIGMFRCVELKISGRYKEPFLSTLYKGNCSENFWTLNGKRMTFNILGLNGLTYTIALTSNNSQLFYLSLWVIRIFVLILVTLFFKYLNIKTKEATLQLNYAKEIEDLTSKFAHDVNPHLSALNTLIGPHTMGVVTEETKLIFRNIINQICDISNEFLLGKRGKNIKRQENYANLISASIEEIVIEKRLYFKSKMDISISCDIYKKECFGLFSSISIHEFKSIISNLINNAVEAMGDQKGEIVVSLSYEESTQLVSITIYDNGPGIPLDILKNLGLQKGLSYGKENVSVSGSGLGIYNARKTIEAHQGHFSIISENKIGTTVAIKLPVISSPKWFAKEVTLFEDNIFVVLDDNQGIHKSLSNKIILEHPRKENVTIIHCFCEKDLITALNDLMNKNVFYFCDFDLGPHHLNGLEILKKYKIFNAVLLTSYYNEPLIQKECIGLGLKIVPKTLLNLVPLNFVKEDELIYHHVLIEDNDFTRDLWDFRFKEKNINLLKIKSPHLFWQYQKNVSEDAHFYIDSDLGEDQISGEEFAKHLHKKGYLRLYLTSGHNKSKFQNCSWIKYIGKNCPY